MLQLFVFLWLVLSIHRPNIDVSPVEDALQLRKFFACNLNIAIDSQLMDDFVFTLPSPMTLTAYYQLGFVESFVNLCSKAWKAVDVQTISQD